MKHLPLFIIAIAAFVFAFVAYLPGLTLALDSPVATPTPVVVPPPIPPDPVPIPPTLLELLLQLIREFGGWLTGLIAIAVGVANKWSTSLSRRLFPNDDRSATRINKGMAEVFAGLSAVALTLIAWGVTYASGLVSGLDLASLLTIATAIFGSGWTAHKVNKTSKIARVFKLVAEMSK